MPTVVPRVVVNKCCSISHAGDLISVIPPAHDDSIFGRVLTQPIICLAEIIDDVLGTVLVSGCQND